jgi:GNAT superfamily N-acetyltransferase
MIMRVETVRDAFGSEDRAEKSPNQGLQILFTAAKIRPKDDDKTTYYGTLRTQHVKVGEFVVNVDWQSKVLLIEELFIERGYRRKGIGKKVLDFLEAKASSLKIQKVVLEPFPIDPGAFTVESLGNWYMKHGYAPFKRNIFAPSTSLLAKAVW